MLSLASSATGVFESICGFGWVGCVEIDLWNVGCAVGCYWVFLLWIAPGCFGWARGGRDIATGWGAQGPGCASLGRTFVGAGPRRPAVVVRRHEGVSAVCVSG